MSDLEQVYNKLWNLGCILRNVDGGIIRADKEVFKELSSAREIVDDLIDYYEAMMDEAEEKNEEGGSE